MITFRSDFQVMHEKLSGINATVFTSMSDGVENTLTNLSSSLDSTVDSLGMRGTWNDNVSIEISGSVRSGLKSIIESCKNPACALIDSIGMNSESLYMKLSNYLEKWKEYEKLLKDKADLLKNEPPKTIYNSKTKEDEPNSDWSNWKEKLNLLEFAIQAMEIAIQSLEATIDSLITTVKSLLGPISASSSSIIGTSKQKEEIIENGTKRVSNAFVDTDGTVIESYALYDSIGNEIGYGNIKYDKMGNKLIEEYSKVLPDGSRKNATITYNGSQAIEVSSIVNKDGTVIQNNNNFTADTTVSEDVQKIIEENNKKTETPPATTTIPNNEVKTVTETTSYPTGFTEKQKAFLNDHANDNNILRLFYGDEEIADNSRIKIKEGETIQVLVKIPTNEGEHIDLCRASIGGGEAYKNGGLRQSNSVSPDRYDRNAILSDTGYYVWTITGEKKGTYQISQTAEFNTERAKYFSDHGNGKFKEMCNLYITVE